MKKISYVLLLFILAGFVSPVVYATERVGESTSTIGIDVRIGFVSEEEGGDESAPDSTYPGDDLLPPGNAGGTPSGTLPTTGAIRLPLFIFGLLAVAIGWVLAWLVKLEKEKYVKIS